MKTVILYTCIATAFILTIIAGKIVWMNEFCNEIGSFATEQADILNRRNYLIQKIITSPNQLIAEMPNIVGRQFQGEWALQHIYRRLFPR